MSKHPLGPWSETHDDRFSRFEPSPREGIYKLSGAKYTESSGTRSQVLGTYDRRTGYNSGRQKKYKTITSSSRSIIETVVEDGFATATSAPFTVSGQGLCYAKHYGIIPVAARALPGWLTPLSTTVDLATARNTCYRKLVNAINMQDVMSGVMGAEGAKTARGLTSGSSAVTSLYNKTYAKVRGRLDSRASKSSMIHQISSDVLNLQLNLLPLCADMDGSLEALADTMVGKQRRQSVVANYRNDNLGASRQKTISARTSNIDGFNGRHEESTKGMLIVKMGGNIVIGLAGEVPSWKDVWGLSPQDFVPTIYELVPYTWLVDYFTSMGAFVDALSLHRGIVTDGYKIEISETSTSYTFTPLTYNSGSAIPVVAAKALTETRRSFQYNRVPFDIDGFVPAMLYQLPSLRQAGNVLALAASKLTRPVKAMGLNPEQLGNTYKALSHNNVR